MTSLAEFARRVERDVAEAVRLLQWVQGDAAQCDGFHDLEPGESALQCLEELERDARAISIKEETKR